MITTRSHSEMPGSSNATSKTQLPSPGSTNENKAITETFTLKKQNIDLRNQLAAAKLAVSTMQQTIETKDSSNFTVVAAAVKSFNDIKIHDEKPNTYYDHERSRYDAFIYQMNHVFQINESLETAKKPKFHKVIFATSYFQKGVLNVWMIALRNAENDTRFFIWETVKALFYKYVRGAKSLDQNIYTKWTSAEQSLNQSVTQYDIYFVNLKSHLSAELKPSELQIMTNFKRGLRLNHKRKILKQSAKLNMKNLIDQVMNFEKDEKLNKKANKKRKNIEENEIEKKSFNKQQRNDFRRDRNRERKNSNRDRDRENNFNREKRGEDYTNDSNFNIEPVADDAFKWFNSLFIDKQNEIKNRKNCYICEKTDHRMSDCSKNPRNKNRANVESSKN